MRINLNADLGESFGAYRIGHDALLLQVVTSANLACGFHGGDPLVMTQTVELARGAGVSIGAHPGFPDLQGFGRRVMHLSPPELRGILLYQIGALDGIARATGSRVTHVKPHGALNNLACEQAELANILAQAVKDYGRDLILLAPARSRLAEAGERLGLPVALEVFSDRAYTDAGQLLPRSHPQALLPDSGACVAQVLRMLEAQAIVSIHGRRLPTPFQSICVHGDHAQAAETAGQIRQALEARGCRLVALPELFA
jgi:5-oxoprolinase (ATP-hydrolysing) subunit A